MRHTSRVGRFLLLLLAMSLVLVACSKEQGTASEGKPIIAYVPPGPPGAEFASALLLSMQTYAEAEGFTFASTSPPQNDIRRQMELIETYAMEGVAGIMVWPADSNALTSAIETANKAGVPVVSIDRQISAGELLATVQSDNAQAARLAGEHMVEMLTERYGEPKGIVLELQAPQTSDVMIMRSQSFQEVIKQYPNITLVTKLFQAATDCEKITMDVLAANPELDGVYAPYDALLPNVQSALTQVGQWVTRDDPEHIFTASIDATRIALDQIRAGYYDVSISQPVTHFGIAARIVREYIDTGKKPQVGDTIVEEGAYWSPAEAVQGKNGVVFLMKCIAATKDNVDSKDLWANALASWSIE